MTPVRTVVTLLALIGAWTLLSFITAPFLGRLFDELDEAGQQPTPTPDPIWVTQTLDELLWDIQLADKDTP